MFHRFKIYYSCQTTLSLTIVVTSLDRNHLYNLFIFNSSTLYIMSLKLLFSYIEMTKQKKRNIYSKHINSSDLVLDIFLIYEMMNFLEVIDKLNNVIQQNVDIFL